MLVCAVDVGSATKLGYADNEGALIDLSTCGGDKQKMYAEFSDKMRGIGVRLAKGEKVSLGFEAPLWVPLYPDLDSLTRARFDLERKLKRPWSAGAGCSVTTCGLVVMPWCFSEISRGANGATVYGTTSIEKLRPAGLYVWEAFVTSDVKGTGHAQDALKAVSWYISKNSPISVERSVKSFSIAASIMSISGFCIDDVDLANRVDVYAPD